MTREWRSSTYGVKIPNKMVDLTKVLLILVSSGWKKLIQDALFIFSLVCLYKHLKMQATC